MKTWKAAYELRNARLAWVRRIQEVMLVLEKHGAPPPDDIGLGHLDWAFPKLGFARVNVTLGTDIVFTCGYKPADHIRAVAGALLPPARMPAQLDVLSDAAAMDATLERWAKVINLFWKPNDITPSPAEMPSDEVHGDASTATNAAEHRDAPYFDPTKNRKPR